MSLVILVLLGFALSGNCIGQKPGPIYVQKVSGSSVVKYINFVQVEEFIKNGSNFFVVLVGNDCYYCKLVLENMEVINKALKEVDQSLEMVAMDIESSLNKPIRDQLKVVALPSIYLFLANLDPILFDLERTPDKIVYFYKQVTSVVVEKIETKKELEAFKNSAYAAVLFVADEDVDITHPIYRVARQNYDAHVGYTVQFSEVYGMFGEWINVFRNGEYRTTVLPNRTTEEIEKFVKVQTHKPYYQFPADAYALPAMYEDNYLFYIDNLAGVDG
ncbi:unnamed protein product [Strongylus vulgaris]|uniref:Thioredoxin domain-containing protein n=1 Tax=Strongylus vulgaris TaxID=40348 RepID=A0A3P7LD72_STRVU|nr:unnamed protein product [Strongylus vulgaris]